MAMNEKITGSLPHGYDNFLQGGKGDDVFSLFNKQFATFNRIDAGDGNDTVFKYGGGRDQIDLGNGNDKAIIAKDLGSTISGGKGNDTLIAEDSARISLLGGSGNDTLKGINIQKSLLDGGTGTDTVSLNGGTNNVVTNGEKVTLQDARNTGVIAGDTGGIIEDNGGQNNLLVAHNDKQNFTLNGTNGTGVVSTGKTDVVVNQATNTAFQTGDKADTITLNGAQNFTGNLGEGDNRAFINDSKGGVVSANSGNDEFQVKDSKNLGLFGQEGNNYFKIDDSKNITAVGGAGNDRVELTDSKNVVVDADAGNNSIATKNSTGTITTGAGKDQLDLVGGSLDANTGAGDDLTVATGVHGTVDDRVVLDAGAGHDTTVVRNSSLADIRNAEDVNVENGYRTLVDSGANSTVTVNGGSRSDVSVGANSTVNAYNTKQVAVTGDAGAQDITLGNVDTAVVNAGDGNNTVRGRDLSNAAITTGKGDDFVAVSGTHNTVDLGAGRNFFIGEGSGSITAGKGSQNTIILAEGSHYDIDLSQTDGNNYVGYLPPHLVGKFEKWIN
jgi:hypothetical protein